MGSRKEHCRKCKQDLGEEFDDVHRWLDGYASKWVEGVHYIDVNHRRKRHHDDGVEEVRKLFGEKAAMAAKHHIIMDFGRVPKKSDYDPKQDKDILHEWEMLFGPSEKKKY